LDIFFHVLVEFVEVDISQYWANDTVLRRPAVRFVKLPLFNISCIRKFPDETDKPFIGYPFFQRVYQDFMADIAKYCDSENPSQIISLWLRTYSTIEYLGLWERLNNLNFKRLSQKSP
jgi:hypothetical protein